MEEKIKEIILDLDSCQDCNSLIHLRGTVRDILTLFQETVEQAIPEKKQGFDVIKMTCKYCGDYDDCDCSGYNEAIDKVKSNLLKAIGPIKTRLVEQV